MYTPLETEITAQEFVQRGAVPEGYLVSLNFTSGDDGAVFGTVLKSGAFVPDDGTVLLTDMGECNYFVEEDHPLQVEYVADIPVIHLTTRGASQIAEILGCSMDEVFADLASQFGGFYVEGSDEE